MIWRFRFGRWRFTFTMARTTYVVGVNSNLEDGHHILMWDFDGVTLDGVKASLEIQQLLNELPTIRILNTGKPNHYIAYCLCRCTWRYAVQIITSTVGVDWGFIKYGVFREHFTLRVTPKEARQIKLAAVLKSVIPDGVQIEELKSWVKYETLTDEQDVKLHELRLFQ